MREDILWLLPTELQYPSGARAPKETLGIFATPDAAFEVMRDHPDFQDVQVKWCATEWEPSPVAYFGWARTRLLRTSQLWEVSVLPFTPVEPVFDFADERTAYERIRYGRA